MATITIDIPDDVSIPRVEQLIATAERGVGLTARFDGFRKIKLVQLNPNAVDQRIRPVLKAVPSLSALTKRSKVGAAVRNANNFDDLPPSAA